MVTGASTADAAVILVDARKGVLTQTRRHSYIVSLLGIRHVVVGRQQDRSGRLLGGVLPRDRGELPRVRGRDRHRRRPMHPGVRAAWATTSSHAASRPAGTSARRCSTTWSVSRSTSSAWNDGPSDCPCSSCSAPTPSSAASRARSRAARSGRATRVRVLPSGRETAVERIVTYDGDLDVAVAGEAITLTLVDDVDVSRGDVVAAAAAPCRGGGPVRGDDRLDERGADAARAQLPHARRA